MSDFAIAIILGIVEGLTEFLPISSTGHLILVNQFVNFTGSFANMFDIVIQLGAILSVVVYFRHKLLPIGTGKSLEDKNRTWRLWLKTIIGVTPALVLGALIGSKVEEYLFNPYVVAVALMIGGLLLIIIESRSKTPIINSVEELSYPKAFAIGIIQCLAMIPGTSRSASTIIGAMLLGTSRTASAEFSFFLAVPTMVAASGYSLLKTGLTISSYELTVLLVGFVTAFLVAWIVIAKFMSFIPNTTFKSFGYYRIVLGALVLFYFMYLQ